MPRTAQRDALDTPQRRVRITKPPSTQWLTDRCGDSERRITFTVIGSPENPLEVVRFAVVTLFSRSGQNDLQSARFTYECHSRA